MSITTNLTVYNKLREMHGILKETFDCYEIMTNEKKNAIDAVGSVLYLAEAVFCMDGKLYDKERS